MTRSRPPSPFIESVRQAIQVRRYARSTEKSYLYWIRYFVRFNRMQHPKDMHSREVSRFLTYLAVEKRVSPSTQNQALSALLFLYRHVLDKPLGHDLEATRAKAKQHLPVVLTRAEVNRLLANLDGVHGLIGSLLYGSGLRLIEACRLRVKDLDFEHQCIFVRRGKGGKDRIVTLPVRLTVPLQDHLSWRQQIWERDRERGCNDVYLPYAIRRKYPDAAGTWGWQYVFPSAQVSHDPDDDCWRRHHIHVTSVQKAVKKAAQRAKVTRQASCHTLRHCFATHLLQAGADIRTIQEQLGHASVQTTMIYTHVLNRGGRAVTSPLDFPANGFAWPDLAKHTDISVKKEDRSQCEPQPARLKNIAKL